MGWGGDGAREEERKRSTKVTEALTQLVKDTA